MQKVLRKRVLREFRENLFRYIALFLLIVLGMYLVVSLVAAAESILVGTDRFAKQQKVESGEFHVFVPLKKEQEKEKRAYVVHHGAGRRNHLEPLYPVQQSG